MKKNKKPINYYGYAFNDCKKQYNKKYAKSKKGKKDIVKCKKYNKKLQKQLKNKGFDDSELWNLDFTIASFIYPRIKQFRTILHGYPNGLSPKKWDKILKRIERSFEIVVKGEFDLLTTKDDKNSSKILHKEFKKGMKYFSKYFMNLWD